MKEKLYEDNDMIGTKEQFIQSMVNHGFCINLEDAEIQFEKCLKEGSIWESK